jgi:hypothetical protein
MDRTYLLFLEKDTEEHFEMLRYTNDDSCNGNGNGTGIKFETIKSEYVLPKYIIVKSDYKDEYFRKLLKTLLINVGYRGKFRVLKPLVREEVLL